MTKFGILGTTALAALIIGGAAAAQTAATNTATTAAVDDGSQLEEITVTAQRRSQNVQDVPIAVSAFTPTELDNRGVTSTLDLIQYVPNLFGSNNTGLGSANAYYIRGLGNTETIATFDPPVGTYIDDVYLSRQNANNFSFFDIERVEVLRGPQGTLFGRNTTGGAVNVILAKPGDELAGYAEVGYGRYSKWLGRGSIDLPFNDKLALKFSGYYQDDKGYVKNVTTGDRLNDSDAAGARVAARIDLSDDISWNVADAYMRNDGENILNFDCNPGAPTQCKGRYVTTGLREDAVAGASQYAPLVISGRKQFFNLGNKVDQNLVTSNFEVRGDNIAFNAITGVVDLRQKFALDFFDGRGGPSLATPNPIVRGFPRGGFTILNDGHHKQFTQEFKINGKAFDGFLDFVAGAYLYDEKNTTDFADVFSVFTGAPGGTPLLLGDRTLRNKTNAQAGYVQLDGHVTDQITLTAGVRYTDETKKFSIADNRAVCAVATPGPTCLSNNNLTAANGVAIPRKQTTKLWTPRFAANFKPNDDVLLFASATRGFKSGGWNARATTPSQLLPFDPEKVWSYEGGVKSELFDKTLRANLTAFYLDTKDLQTPSAFVAANGSITFITQNFADYRNKGLEAELTWLPAKGLNLYVNGGYQDDHYKVSDTLLPNRYGITSVRAQQNQCRAQLAAGQIPLGTSTAVAPAAPNNAPACAAGIIDAQGNIASPVRTPKFTFSAGGSYDYELGGKSGAILSPSVNVVYTASLETGTANATIYSGAITGVNGTYTTNPNGGDFITGSESKAHTFVNAALSLKTDDGNWLLAAECDNCFNKVWNESSLSNYTYISKPMTWTIRARRKF